MGKGGARKRDPTNPGVSVNEIRSGDTKDGNLRSAIRNARL